LLDLQSTYENKNRKEKAIQATRATKEHKTPSLKPLMNGEDLIFGMCLGVNAIALVLNVNFRKLGCH
jgi:hypothetical protein